MKKFPDLQDTIPLVKQWVNNRAHLFKDIGSPVKDEGPVTFDAISKSEYLDGLTLLYEKAIEEPSAKSAFLPKPSFVVVFDRFGSDGGRYSKCITRIVVRKSIGSSLKTSFFYE